jgi:hypothetical protein
MQNTYNSWRSLCAALQVKLAKLEIQNKSEDLNGQRKKRTTGDRDLVVSGGYLFEQLFLLRVSCFFRKTLLALTPVPLISMVHPMKHLKGVLIVAVLLFTVCACGGQDSHNARGYGEAQDMQAVNSDQRRMSTGDASRNTLGGRAEVLVRFKDEIDTTTIERIQRETGLRILKVVSPPRLYLMEITDGSEVEAMLERLKGYPEIVYAEPNRLRTLKRN